MMSWFRLFMTVMVTSVASPAFAFLVSSSGSGNSDPTINVLPAYNDAYINWQNAGLVKVGGIPNRTTVCATVSPTGITPPAAGDDAATINTAITNCAAGDVLMLAAGTFQITQSEYILLNKNITLRGTGNCSNSSSPYCQTAISVYDGAIADWTISGFPAGANCGVTAASTSSCSAPTGIIRMSPSAVYNTGWGAGSALAVDAPAGTTTVQVASTANFSVGMWVLISENPLQQSTVNPVDNGQANVSAAPDWLSTSGSPVTLRVEGGDIPGSYGTNLNHELHLVIAKGTVCPGAGCTLTFDDPLTNGFHSASAYGAGVYWPTDQSGNNPLPFLQSAGVENMYLTRPGNGGIELNHCAYCWVKNVEVYGWIAGGVNVNESARNQIEGNYIHQCFDCENNGAEYPLGISYVSMENYIDNNIIVLGGKGMVGRAAGTNVIAYNYVDKTMYMGNVIGDYWVDMSLNGSHYAGTNHWLFEGNWANNCDNDETHGNAIYHVYFRNDCTGLRTAFTDVSLNKTVDDANGIGWASPPPGTATAPNPLRAVGPMAFDYWMGYVGNVLGLLGQTTAAQGWTYKCTSASNKCIWMSGYTLAEWNYAPDPNLNGTNTPQFIFRHGNYDYVNVSIADWAAGYSQTLPNSFYLSARPSFFGPGASCTYPWPWVTPTGSQPIQTNSCAGAGLPAKARFDAGTPFVQP